MDVSPPIHGHGGSNAPTGPVPNLGGNTPNAPATATPLPTLSTGPATSPASGNQPGGTPGRPVSEHSSGNGTDRARFDDGTHRYNWNVRTNENGDHSGTVGAGYRRGNNDVYVGSNFDEASGRIDGNAGGSHRFENGTTLRGNLGGVIHNGTEVDPEFTNGEIGARHNIGPSTYVDGAVGTDAARGDYVSGAFSNTPNSRRTENARVEYSENGGVNAEYTGRHAGNGWTSEENLRVNNGNVTGSLSGTGTRRVGDDTTLSGRARVTTSGEYSVDGSAAHRINNNVTVNGGATVANNRRGVRGGATIRGEHGSSHRVTGAYNEALDHNGEVSNRSGEVGHDYNHGNGVRNSVRVGGDTRGNRHIENTTRYRSPDGTEYRGGVRVDENTSGVRGGAISGGVNRGRVSVDGRVAAREDGTGSVSGNFRRRADNGTSYEVRGNANRTTDGGIEGDGSYRYNYNNETSSTARVARGSNGWSGDATHSNNRANGGESVSVGYAENGGLRGEARAHRNFGEDNHHRVGGSLSGSSETIRGEVNGETRLGENDDVTVGGRLFGETNNNRVGGDIRGARTATDDRLGINGRLNAERDDNHIAIGTEGGLAVKNLLGSGIGGRVGIGGGVDIKRRKKLAPGSDWRGDMRRDALEGQPEGTEFITYGGASHVSGNAGTRIPIGTGYADVGYRLGRRLEVEHIRLTDDLREGELPSTTDLFSSANADAVRELRAGEGIKLTGETTHAFTGAVGLGRTTESNRGIEGTARVGLNGSVALSGRTTTEVVRGEGESARIVVSAVDSTKLNGGIEARVGVTPNMDTLLTNAGVENTHRVGPAGEVVKAVADNAVRSFFSAGVSVGRDNTDLDSRLVDARLDLSHEDVRAAYDKALEGDWTELEALNRANHPGVEITRSVFTELTEDGVPLSAFGLGLSASSDSRETLRNSDVILNDANYDVESDRDRNARSAEGWFSGSSVSVEDYTRTVTPEEGASMDGVKPLEHWLTWEGKQSDSFTSKDELLGGLNLASFISSGDQEEPLDAYRAKIGAMAEHRKMWIGPRNELRKTSLKTRVRVADEGMDKVANLDEATVWDAYATAWRATDTSGWYEPDWLDASKRTVVENMHESEQPYSYMAASYFVTNLVEASKITDEEERNDAIREAISGSRGISDAVPMAALIELVGRAAVEVTVTVDSNAGTSGSEYDFSFTHRGPDFNVQGTVFGAEL